MQKKLEALPDIDSCEVNFATESARIGSQTPLHPKQLIDWVRTFGFSVQTSHQVFRTSAAQLDEKALQNLLANNPIVVAFQLNRELKSIDFTTLPDANTRELREALEALGLSKVTTSDQGAPIDDLNNHRDVWISLLLASPLVIQMIGMWLGSNWHLPVTLEWLLATPIQVWLGLRFYRGAMAAMRRGEA
ncbi:MAG: hypothetical protein VW907_05030, partial [Opitutae bacterium]